MPNSILLPETARARAAFAEPPSWADRTVRTAGTGRPAAAVTDVLTVGPDGGLHDYIARLCRDWTVTHRYSGAGALEFLRHNWTAVTIWDCETPEGTWKDVRDSLTAFPAAPRLLVVVGEGGARTAPGAFDVLVRPFDDVEVLWSVASAWHSWMKRFEASAGGLPCSDA